MSLVLFGMIVVALVLVASRPGEGPKRALVPVRVDRRPNRRH